MKNALVAAVCSAVLAGCAGFGVPDCGSDWYAVGQRDGMLGASSQAERYATKCPGIDRSRYEEGKAAGFAARGRVAAP